MSDKVSEFQAVTNSDAETAQFYLESSGGDLTTALESYYANVDMHPPQEPPSTERPSSHRPQPPVHLLFSKPSFQITLQVASFADMDEDDSSDGPEDNEYYAGGQNSGVAIRGGKKRDHVENLFESVREHGAIQGTDEDLATQTGRATFSGQARTLAGDVLPPSNRPVERPPVVIAFYTNGVFTVDDGEPRRIDDPANTEFLQSIRQGVCPQELLASNGGRPIKVNLVRKQTEYTPPAQPRYRAFSGTGRTLTSEANSQNPVQPIVAGEWEGADETQPTTSIQIRLSDGSRVVARFNYSHTVRDIRRFIAASRPDLANRGSMMTSFPTKELKDDNLTIEQAGLVNAVIIQK